MPHPDAPAPSQPAATVRRERQRRRSSTRPATPAAAPESPATPEPVPEAPELPPLELSEGTPGLVSDGPALAAAVARLAAGSGPLAVDTERASGYRYGQRAYLLQFRRVGAGTILLDPIACPDLDDLATVINPLDWILHAASQDLPCLAELGLVPRAVFDTELAGRLLNLERVGLAPMVAALLGKSLAKAHGAEDWSTRPMPESWLRYAALDVEPLVELKEILEQRLADAGKLEWAREEFAAIAAAAAVPAPPPPPDRWRRTSGIHRIRTRRGLAIVQAMWTARDDIAAQTDTAPGRILPDSALVAAAMAEPRTTADLMAVSGFNGRGRTRHRAHWSRALQEAMKLREADLPISVRGGAGAPPARAWSRRDPAAARRLELARAAVVARAEELDLPAENLVSPQAVRDLAWQPPAPCDTTAIADALTAAGAREWQVRECADLLANALVGKGR